MLTLMTCHDCICEFLAATRGATLCPQCREARRKAHDNRRRDPRPAEFIAIDGEGTGDSYTLLGIGQDQYEWPTGLASITEAFEKLYATYLANPRAYFVGFFLTYDWNMWLKTLPRNRAAALLEPDQMAKRRRKANPHAKPFPVDYQGWQFDMLWGKRFRLKPASAKSWMTICDTGPFFQSSLLKALANRPQDSEVTQEMFDKIAEGKSKRSIAVLDDEMRDYNRLENRALEIMLAELDGALRHIGTPLGKTQFHGPGQAAQKWLKQQDGLQRTLDAVNALPTEIFDPVQGSYYGGIFETTVHGHTAGPSYEYDINSAYPDVIATLPCLCGQWLRGTGVKPVGAKLVLWHGEFIGKSRFLGPLPHRLPDRRMCRPLNTSGWYWDFEIAASLESDLLSHYQCDEWVAYLGCDHPPPLAAVAGLYEERLKVGKGSALGKALKLIYNSAYGKLAQSVGNPQVSCAVYASLITARCRAKILRAIGTHPQGVAALLMIATDAVFFNQPHPTLPISDRLGEWDLTTHDYLTIFRPGLYWDNKSRAAIKVGNAPVFKTRGVRASDFSQCIQTLDEQFADWYEQDDGQREWPRYELVVAFSQVSVKQALAQTRLMKGTPQEIEDAYRAKAGKVIIDGNRVVTSDPFSKRNKSSLFSDTNPYLPLHLQLFRTFTLDQGTIMESTPYDKRFGKADPDELDELHTDELAIDALIHEMLESD